MYLKNKERMVCTFAGEMLINAIEKAKKQPKIEKIVWKCTQKPIANDPASHNKIHSIIESVNNHEKD